MLLALLVLHLCKVSCLCRCIVQRLGSADISVLAYNFWQATKASLLLVRQSPYFPPFPGKGAGGIGIVSQKFVSKTDFFFKLT